MCGINGILYKEPKNINNIKEALTTMNNLIFHRGPDDDGVFCEENSSFSLGMAMRRLSIIDLTSGKQPIYNEDKSIVIVFNGEIYNYRALKSKLEVEGIHFNTTSDTEVILKLYEKYGITSFKWLDGMFAFSIYDKSKNKLFIARDFFGEKPLYYTKTKSKFLWASELKSVINSQNLKPKINKEALNLFLRLTYIPSPYSIYEGIYKLEPNSYIEYDINSFEFSINKIHNDINFKKSNITFEDAKKEVKKRVYNSVESRSVSDVPLGTFLSGGVDSSIVSYCLAEMQDTKIDTFSIGFEKTSYNETDKSRVVANLIQSNHHEFIINENDLKNNVHDILLNFDEPFADSSALPTFLVSNRTKAHVKVALTGDGGDEMFGGYNKYYIGKLNNKYTKFVPSAIHNSIKKLSTPLLKRKDDNRGIKYKLHKLINAIDYTDGYYWDIISLGFNESDIEKLLSKNCQQENLFNYYKYKTKINKPVSLNDFRNIDRHISLEGDMLVKVDRTSMLNSLECRAPFLNRELFNFTMQLPENYLLNKWSKKHVLKEAFKDVFPDEFLEKSKQGFGVPVGNWLRQSLKKELLSLVEKDFLKNQDIFNVEAIIVLVENHLSGKQDNTFKVWTFYCFQKWYKSIYANL
jgi:asparagine synthase (glutamine-hydrolysing)